MLGVSRGASLDEIRSAFRRQALLYHPDTCPGNRAEAEAKFLELTQAYQEVLNSFGPDVWNRLHGPGFRTWTPADFARMESQWPYARRDDARGDGRSAWARLGFPQKRIFARVNETSVFVWFWALAVLLGFVAGLIAMESGIIGEVTTKPTAGDVMTIAAAAIGVYVVVVAGTLLALVLIREVIWLTIQLGRRLLPRPSENAEDLQD